MQLWGWWIQDEWGKRREEGGGGGGGGRGEGHRRQEGLRHNQPPEQWKAEAKASSMEKWKAEMYHSDSTKGWEMTGAAEG